MTKHRIDLLQPDSAPLHSGPYRVSPTPCKFEKLRLTICSSKISSSLYKGNGLHPIVLVPDNDGTIQFCLDYRKLNAVAKQDSHPTPCTDKCIESLGEAPVFLTLEAIADNGKSKLMMQTIIRRNSHPIMISIASYVYHSDHAPYPARSN